MRERRIRKLKGHPHEGYQYFLGGDPSGGTGNDDAAIIVLCADTIEQVYAFNDNTTNPVEYAYLCAAVGKEYNEAYLTIEGNNHGLSVHPILTREYNRVKIFKRSITSAVGIMNKYGFMTTENSKPMLTGAIQDAFDFGLTVYDRETVEALQVFEEDDTTGKMGGVGDHLVIALGLACFGMLRKGHIHLAQANLPDRETHRQKITRLFNKKHQVNCDDILEDIEKGHRRTLGRFRRQVA